MAEIIIHQRPFTSQEASTLIPKLDQELSDLYPDWPTLPHPGADVGLMEKPIDLNPKPEQTDAQINTQTSILDDAEPNPPSTNKGTSDGLVFFVAYLTPGSDAGSESKAIGCMGLKAEPHYPHHHDPSAYQGHLQDQVAADIERESSVKTAQLKRLYVDKAYRSKAFTPSVASLLLLHCEEYARTSGIRRLVVETGVRQVGALRLYERHGYRYIDNFGDYASTSVEKGGVSVCFEKVL